MHWLILIPVVVAVAFGVRTCASDEAAFQKQASERRAEREAEEAAGRVPKVISEADGCKVYTFFERDRWHYFVRCADASTTTAIGSRSVRVGKYSRTEHEAIQATKEPR